MGPFEWDTNSYLLPLLVCYCEHAFHSLMERDLPDKGHQCVRHDPQEETNIYKSVQ